MVNGELLVRTGERRITNACLAPDRAPVETAREGAYTRIKLPVFEGYALVVLEYGE